MSGPKTAASVPMFQLSCCREATLARKRHRKRRRQSCFPSRQSNSLHLPLITPSLVPHSHHLVLTSFSPAAPPLDVSLYRRRDDRLRKLLQEEAEQTDSGGQHSASGTGATIRAQKENKHNTCSHHNLHTVD
ncbi:hypothetical protein EYF80_013853 [Liparis tanakae]|uniref:Uncharacterized protein n=1 Tax=Liparis tanakae TaxID=230148 RepID=A0A4Z2IFJ8_9TELE|nr:hypothetical protein EYF80_013853 [Liparis tanakae]